MPKLKKIQKTTAPAKNAGAKNALAAGAVAVLGALVLLSPASLLGGAGGSQGNGAGEPHPSQPDPLNGVDVSSLTGRDAFAACLTQAGLTFYGAYWCPNCQRQREILGPSMRYIRYIECSPRGRSAPQDPACTRAGVQAYPTWRIHGANYVGVRTLQQLGQLAGCTPP